MVNPAIAKTDTELVARLRWSSLFALLFAGLFAACIFFSWRNGILGRAFASFSPDSAAGSDTILLGVVMILLIIFATLALVYAVVRSANSTEFRAGEARLSVRHGPLPWFAARVDLEAASIEGFALVHRVDRPIRGKRRGGPAVGGSLDWYRLAARTRNGDRTALVSLSPALEGEEALAAVGQALAERYGKTFAKLEG